MNLRKRFRVVPETADLPPGVFGFTQFGKNGVEGIFVARELDEATAKPEVRRLRTTLAHEAGHGLLHAHLFAFAEESPSSPDLDLRLGRVLCRDQVPRARGTGYDGRWWEFQANRAMASLLLPHPLVSKYLDAALPTRVADMSESDLSRTVAEMGEVFDVNAIVARFRLEAIRKQHPEKW